MNTSRLIWGAFLSGAMLTACGCRSAPPPTTQPQPPTPYVGNSSSPSRSSGQSPIPGTSSEQPAPLNTAAALAQRARLYAQAMASDHGRSPGAATQPASSEFPDPDAMRLTLQPQFQTPSQPDNSAPAKEPRANASISVPTAQRLVSADHPAAPITQTPAVESTSGLARQLDQRAKDYPADLSAQMDDQLLKLLHDQPVPDMASLAGLAPEDRELLSGLMDAMTNFRNQLRADNNQLFSRKIRPLLDLADRLRSQAELSVPTVALCTSVKAYGVYEPISPARFIAGQEHRVVLYCEVENFMSQPNDKNLYETRLTQDVVLYTEASGLPVWSDKQSTYVDQARRRRHDFFMGKIITLPANLSMGRYLLKVTVEDQQARHIAENTLPVEIVAQ